MACYGFSSLTMIQTAIAPYDINDKDTGWFVANCILFIVIHLFFAIYGFYLRIFEKKKLDMTGKELRNANVEETGTRLNLKYDETVYERWNQKCLLYRAREPIKTTAFAEFKQCLMKAFPCCKCIKPRRNSIIRSSGSLYRWLSVDSDV